MPSNCSPLRFTNPEAWDALNLLEGEVLTLPDAEKRALRHCRETGATAPANLADLAEEIAAAEAQIPEAREAIDKALAFDPDTDPTPEEAADVARQWAILLSLLDGELKSPLAAAVRSEAGRKALTTKKTQFLFSRLLDSLIATENHPGDTWDILANGLSVTPAELRHVAARATTGLIKLPTLHEESFLPGLEPKIPRFKVPTYQYNPKTLIPTASLVRTMHQRALLEGAVEQFPIDKRPHEHFVFMVMLDALGQQYPITATDKNILIGLGNLYKERKNATGDGVIVTAADIIRRYRGLGARDTVEQTAIDRISERMEYLAKIRVSFDFSQHFDYRKKDIGEGETVELDIPDTMRRPDEKHPGTVVRFSYIGNMVHADTIEVEYDSGRIERAWKILAPPIVFDYAEKIHQVATVETKLLDIRKRANGSTHAEIIKIYLIERINAMRDRKTKKPRADITRVISLETLFFDLRIEVLNRQTKKRLADITKGLLQHFAETKGKDGCPYIAGFKENRGRRGAVTGYEIKF